MSFTLPAALVGGAATAVLSGLSARERNKALADANKQSQARLNATLVQMQVEKFQKTAHLARESQASLGMIMNSIPPENIEAVRVLGRDLALRVSSDQFGIEEELRRRTMLIEAEKQDTAARLNNQQANVGLSAIQGFSSGFQAGAGVGEAFAGARQATDVAEKTATITGLREETARLRYNEAFLSSIATHGDLFAMTQRIEGISQASDRIRSGLLNMALPQPARVLP